MLWPIPHGAKMQPANTPHPPTPILQAPKSSSNPQKLKGGGGATPQAHERTAKAKAGGRRARGEKATENATVLTGARTRACWFTATRSHLGIASAVVAIGGGVINLYAIRP
jgi:hypothetical protein